MTAPAPRSSLVSLTVAHLLPGVLLVLLWCVCAPALLAAGLPPVLGLLLAVPVLLVPWVVVGIRRRRDAGAPRVSIAAFAGLVRVNSRTARTRVLPLGVAAALFPGITVPLELVLHRPFESALPAWWNLTASVEDGPLVVTAWLLFAVLLGPVSEEIWFRGVLQPRLPGGRTSRVVVGSALFTVYHLWQPWAWPTILLTTVPLAVLRETRASTTGAAIVHVAVNALTVPLILFGGLQR